MEVIVHRAAAKSHVSTRSKYFSLWLPHCDSEDFWIIFKVALKYPQVKVETVTDLISKLALYLI